MGQCGVDSFRQNRRRVRGDISQRAAQDSEGRPDRKWGQQVPGLGRALSFPSFICLCGPTAATGQKQTQTPVMR